MKFRRRVRGITKLVDEKLYENDNKMWINYKIKSHQRTKNVME